MKTILKLFLFNLIFLSASMVQSRSGSGSGVSGSGYDSLSSGSGSGSGFSSSGSGPSGSGSGFGSGSGEHDLEKVSGSGSGSGSGQIEIPEGLLSMSVSTLLSTSGSVSFTTTPVLTATQTVSSTSVFASPTPTPTTDDPDVPSVLEQTKQSILMVFRGVSLAQWNNNGGLLERKFKNATAYGITQYCRANPVKCGFQQGTISKRSSDITFVADDILILPDYPKELDGNLEVAYTVLMPQGSGVAGGAMVPAAVALSAAMLYKDDLELMTGLTVEKMEQLSPPGVSQGQASEEVVISSVVVCVGVALIVGAIVGVILVWRGRNYIRHRRELKKHDTEMVSEDHNVTSEDLQSPGNA